jgi:hypothetical protein
MLKWLFAVMVVFGVGAATAHAQLEATFRGWTKSGDAVVFNVAEELTMVCKPGRFDPERAAPLKGCTECKSKKACLLVEEAKASSQSADGTTHAEPLKEHAGILLVTLQSGMSRRLHLRAGRDAKVSTYFRMDSKALAIHVHADEEWVFIVDLTQL